MSLACNSPVASSKLKAWVGERKSSAEEMGWPVVGASVGSGVGVSSWAGADIGAADMVEDLVVVLTVLVVRAVVLRVRGAATTLVVLIDLVGLVVRADLVVLVDLVDLVDLMELVVLVELAVLAVFLETALVLARLVERPSIDLFLSIVYNYTMAKLKITKKQQAVLNFLEDFTEENGYSPSYREIQSGLGLSSVSAVAEHIDNMVSKGILKKVPGAARSLEVLDFRHTETVELFRARLMDASEEERKVLLAAAEVLGLDLGE